MEVLLGFAGLPSTTSSFKIILLLLLDFPPNSFPHCASSKPKFTVCGRREGKAESSSSTGLPTAGEDTLRHVHYWRHPVRPTILETHPVTPTLSETSCATCYQRHPMTPTICEGLCATNIVAQILCETNLHVQNISSDQITSTSAICYRSLAQKYGT